MLFSATSGAVPGISQGSIPYLVSKPPITGSQAPGAVLTRPTYVWEGADTIVGNWYNNSYPTDAFGATYADTEDGDIVEYREFATNEFGNSLVLSWPQFLVSSAIANAAYASVFITDLITGKSPSDRSMWTNADPPWSGSPTLVTNPDFFAPSLRPQLTGTPQLVGGGWLGSYGLQAISPRHGISCAHNGPQPGLPVTFVNVDGTAFTTTITKWICDDPSQVSRCSDTQQTLEADFSVYLFADELPEWAYIAPVLAMTTEQYADFAASNPPTLVISQGNSTSAVFPYNPGSWTPHGRMLYVSGTNPGVVRNALEEPFTRRPKVVGDSGTPEFLVKDGNLCLFRTMTSSDGSGPFVHEHIDYINSMMTRADVAEGISTGHQLTVLGLPSTTTSMTVVFDIEGFEGYSHRVEVTPMDGGTTDTYTIAPGDNSHEFTGLDYNTQYDVRIFRIDGDSYESAPLVAEVYTAPAASPTALSATATGENSIDLSWTNPSPLPHTGYQIEKSLDNSTWTAVANVSAATTSYSVTGLPGATLQYFRVRAWNDNPSEAPTYASDAFAAWSSTASATTDTDMTAPVLSAVSATAGDATAALAATSNEAGTMYLFVSTSATPPSAATLKAGTGAAYASNAACIPATPFTATATGLTNGTTYYLHALANDGTNDSTITTTASFAPAAPNAYAGVIAYWQLDEASGTRVDTVGGLNLVEGDGTVGSAAVTGKAFTTAARFVDGNTDYLTKDTGCNILHNRSAFSVAMWLKPTAEKSVFNCGSGAIRAQMGDAKMYFTVAGTFAELPHGTLNEWVLWVFTYDDIANLIAISKNGAGRFETAHAASNNTALADFRLGVFADWFDGDIGPVAWFGHAIDDEQIALLYNGGTGVLYTP